MRKLCLILLLGFYSVTTYGYGKVDTIYLDITSTVHLIFKTTVLAYDLGSGAYIDESGNMISDVAYEANGNRIKLAPMVSHFETTNFFVETKEAYYNFILMYKEGPKSYVITVPQSEAVAMKEIPTETKGVDQQALFGGAPVTTAVAINPGANSTAQEAKPKLGTPKEVCEKIVGLKQKGTIVGTTSQKVNYWIDGVYVQGGLIYFKVNVENLGNIVYDWGYTGVFIRDKGKKTLKSNSVIQEEQFDPVFTYNEHIKEVGRKDRVFKVIVFEKFTIESDKVLSFEFWEIEGERKVILEVRSTHLLEAERI